MYIMCQMIHDMDDVVSKKRISSSITHLFIIYAQHVQDGNEIILHVYHEYTTKMTMSWTYDENDYIMNIWRKWLYYEHMTKITTWLYTNDNYNVLWVWDQIMYKSNLVQYLLYLSKQVPKYMSILKPIPGMETYRWIFKYIPIFLNSNPDPLGREWWVYIHDYREYICLTPWVGSDGCIFYDDRGYICLTPWGGSDGRGYNTVLYLWSRFI